jgi:MFS family permease
MIINGELSLSQQKTGRNGLLSFSFLNGLALTCITGNLLSLYLLNMGCIPAFIAIISSFTYLGTLFAFAGKSSISKIGAAATIKYSWLICSFAAMSLALIPFIDFSNFNKTFIVIIITVTAFIFCVFKSIGTAALQPLMGEVTDKNNQGRFSSKFFLLYSLATIFAIAAILCLISINNSLFMFQLIIFIGAIIILFSSSIFIKIKETNVPRKSAGKRTKKLLFSTIWKNTDYRIFLFVRSFSRACIILTIPISILALIKMYDVSNLTALFFTCVQLCGGIFISYFNGIISGQTGPKPLVIIYIGLLFIVCLFWILAPAGFHWRYCTIIFFLCGVCQFGLDSCLNHYYLTLIPRENSVGISLWYTTIGGAVAGLSGLVLGGGLIDLFSTYLPYTTLFRYYYCTMLLIITPVFYLVLKLNSTSAWKVSDILSLAVSPHELQALFSLRNIQKYSTASGEIDNVLKLQGMNSNLSEESLLYYLDSPAYFVRLSALRALNCFQIGEKAKLAVYKELENGDFSCAYLAAIILARNKMPEAIPLLRKYLSSKDLHLKANSMIALASMEDTESYDQIIEIFKSSSNPRIITNGAMALQILKDINTVEYLLRKTVLFYNSQNKQKEYVIDELICSIANIYGYFDIFYKSHRIFHDSSEVGTLNILESVDKDKVDKSPIAPEKVLRSFLDNLTKKDDMVNFLADTINTKPEKKTEFKAICNFLKGTEPDRISDKLLVCIWIILFCKKE